MNDTGDTFFAGADSVEVIWNRAYSPLRNKLNDGELKNSRKLVRSMSGQSSSLVLSRKYFEILKEERFPGWSSTRTTWLVRSGINDTIEWFEFSELPAVTVVLERPSSRVSNLFSKGQYCGLIYGPPPWKSQWVVHLRAESVHFL